MMTTTVIDKAKLNKLVALAGRAGTAAAASDADETEGGVATPSRKVKVARGARAWDNSADGGSDLDERYAGLTAAQLQFATLVMDSLHRDVGRKKNITFAPASARMRRAAVTSYQPKSWYFKRFNDGGDGEGAEMIDDCPTGAIWENAICESPLMGLFPPAPVRGGVIKVPTEGALPTGYTALTAVQNCDDLQCTPSSTAVTKLSETTVGKMRIKVCFPLELEEDAFLDVLPEYERMLRRGMALSVERVLARGDMTTSPATSNINYNGAALVLPASGFGPDFVMQDGLAHSILIDNVANCATTAVNASGWFTAGDPLVPEDLSRLRNLMADSVSGAHWGYCSDISRLVYVCDFQTYGKLVELEDVKHCDDCSTPGMLGTLNTGRLAQIWGIPIIPLSTLTLTNALGIVDAATPANNVYGQLYLINLDGFAVGTGRELSVTTKVDDDCDRVEIFASWRFGFVRRTSTGLASGIEAVAGITGISVA